MDRYTFGRTLVADVVAPDSLIAIGRYVITPAGLYAIGALRVAIGLVLILVGFIAFAVAARRQAV